MVKPRILAIIPARSGSIGIPHKNIMDLGGHPLLSWSIAAAKLTPEINEVIVSTDSKNYQDTSIKYGANVPFLRPQNISMNHSGDLGFMLHALNYFRSQKREFDFVVHLRPTTPFRDPAIVSLAINTMLNNMENNTALRSVHKSSESAYK